MVAVCGCDHLQTKEAVQAPSKVVTRQPPVAPPPAEMPEEVERVPIVVPPPSDAKPAERPDLPPLEPGDVRVALLLPLSGRLSDIGTGLLNAAQMALFDVADDRLQLVPFDTAGTTDGAQAAAKKAVSNQASLILGPLLGSSTTAVRPIAKAGNVPVISFSSDRKVGGNGVYVIGFTPETEVERVMTYTAETGANRFVLLGPKDSYGDTVAAAVKKTARDRNLIVVRVELYDPKTSNFALLIERIKGTQQNQGPQPLPPPPTPGTPASPTATAAATATPAVAAPPQLNFDALLIADGGDRLRRLTSQLAQAGLGPDHVRLLGTGAWDEPSLAQEQSLAGAWIAAPEPSFRVDFETRYRELFGKPPPRLATLGYDGTALAAVLARDHGRDGLTDGWLTNPDGFFGRDGLFRLMPDGYADRRLAVLQIGGDRTGVISEAPRRFAGF